MSVIKKLSLLAFLAAALLNAPQPSWAAGCEYTDYPNCSSYWDPGTGHWYYSCAAIVSCQDIRNCLEELCPGQNIDTCQYESGAYGEGWCLQT